MRHLQMATQHIDAEPLRLQHHVAHKLFGRRGVDGLRIKILVERRDHVEGFAVQEQLTIARGKLPESETRSPAIRDRAFQRRIERVQRRRPRSPQLRLLDTPLQHHRVRLYQRTNALPHHAPGVVMHGHADTRVLYSFYRLADSLPRQLDIDAELAIYMWRDVGAVHIDGGRELKSHTLPYARVLHVPVLLSVRDLVVQHFREQLEVQLLVHRR